MKVHFGRDKPALSLNLLSIFEKIIFTADKKINSSMFTVRDNLQFFPYRVLDS